MKSLKKIKNYKIFFYQNKKHNKYCIILTLNSFLSSKKNFTKELKKN